MKEWQYNILFFVCVGGVLLLLVGPGFGLEVNNNPQAIAGLGAITTFVLTQKPRQNGKTDVKKTENKKEVEDESQ